MSTKITSKKILCPRCKHWSWSNSLKHFYKLCKARGKKEDDQFEISVFIGRNNPGSPGWSIQNGRWVHRILTIKNNTMKFYKDGELKWSKKI